MFLWHRMRASMFVDTSCIIIALLPGLACIFLAFVDGKGQSVQLLPSPKPSPNAFTEPIDRSMFDSLLQIVEFKQPRGSAAARSPGELS